MERIPTTQVQQHIGQRVRVQGWLHALRRLGGVTFVVVRDGWGTVQAVSEDEAELAALSETAGLGAETVLALEGLVVAEPQAPGGVELRQLAVEVLTPVAETLPLPLNKRQIKASLPTLLDHAVVANRHPARRAVFRLAAGAMAGFRATLGARGFTEIQTPKIVASATESGSNVFQLDYFGRPAYLAQSPQFYKQIMVGVFERVFEVGPVFRAEPHDTTRHVNEYVSLDVEFGFIEDHFTVMALARDVIAGILETLQAGYAAELALLEARLPAVPAAIPHIHFAEAQELILQRHGVDVRGEPDLSPQDERWLGAWAQEEHGSDFLFVTGYPMAKRPFYTHPDPTPAGLQQLLRPALPRRGADHRRPAAAPLRRLPGRAGAGRLSGGAVRELPGGLPLRHAAPRRLRHRPGAPADAVAGPAQPAPGDAVPRDMNRVIP